MQKLQSPLPFTWKDPWISRQLTKLLKMPRGFTRILPEIMVFRGKWVYLQYDRFLSCRVIFHQTMIMGDRVSLEIVLPFNWINVYEHDVCFKWSLCSISMKCKHKLGWEMFCLVKNSSPFQLLVIFLGVVVVGVEKFCPINKGTSATCFFGVDDFWFKKNVQNRVVAEMCVDYN